MPPGKFIPRPITEDDTDIALIRDPWFEEAFSQTSQSIAAGEPLRGALVHVLILAPLHILVHVLVLAPVHSLRGLPCSIHRLTVLQVLRSEMV